MEKNKELKTKAKKAKKKNFQQISSIKWNQFPLKSQAEKSNDYKFTLPQPCFFKKTAYITVRKDYLWKSQAELRTENFANRRF